MSERRLLLSAESLSVGYGDRSIVERISFALHDSEVLAVVGPNGSGKTTLIRTLLGMLAPLRGSVGLHCTEGKGMESAVAYIPQRIDIDRTFPISLKEMLALSSPASGTEAERFLDFLDLRPLLNTRVGDLSGGQLQRAMMAYAAAKGPRLLVMDEPTSWVDAKGSDCALCIMEEFKARGIGMIVVTHDYTSLSGIATHVLGLSSALEGGYFYGPADSEEVREKASSLLGAGHHHSGAGGHIHCAFRLSTQKGGQADV